MQAAGIHIAGVAIGGFTGVGILVEAPLGTPGLQLSGVFVGTDATGTVARPNGIGIHTDFGAAGLAICDAGPGGRNLVSGNAGDGILLHSGDFTIICNTYVGTNASGSVSLPNLSMGIEILTSPTHTQIQGNVIAGNFADGIFVESGNTGTVITSNLIGVGADGTTGIPNGGNGVTILTDGVTVGGDPGSAGNVIASNGGHGVDVTSGSNNAIQGNSMYGNGGRGINLLADGSVPANDACDVDAVSRPDAPGIRADVARDTALSRRADRQPGGPCDQPG